MQAQGRRPKGPTWQTRLPKFQAGPHSEQLSVEHRPPMMQTFFLFNSKVSYCQPTFRLRSLLTDMAKT